jgi:glycogen debranching enzyme
MQFNPEKAARGAMLYFLMRIEACKKITPRKKTVTIKTDLDRTFLTLSSEPQKILVVDSMEEAVAAIHDRAPLRARYWDGDREVRYLVLGNTLHKRRKNTILLSARSGRRIPSSIERAVLRRKSFYTSRIKTGRKDTLAKALSILKVNVESPQGAFSQRWTTPDRFPHRHLWLWDSCFHAPAYATIDKRLGEDTLTSVLDTQQPNGFVPHIGRPNGDFSNITQPPLLAWAALSVFRITGNRKFLKRSFRKIHRYLAWCVRNRDKNRNSLLEWKRSDESGMDNSSRFNKGFTFDAVDFSSIFANDLQCLYEISTEIGEPDARLQAKAKKVHAQIQSVLWNKSRKFFYDRYPSGRFSPYKTACGFLPLFSGSASKEQAANLVAHLEDDRSFRTPLPVPSEAIDSPTFDNNMWRGPVWLNYNYFIIQGLKRYGYHDLADRIRERTLSEVERWYRREGTIFEFYDPFAKLSPRRIPRKDTYGAIKEFGWSASIYLLLKREGE